MGESADAPKWAALARAHHHRAGQLLSPDGYYYEGMEYWIFSAPWLVHFLDAWEHSTGENLWDRGQYRNWKYSIAHSILPDGQTVFDFGDIWQGPLTRAKQGEDYAREYPTGTLKSNFNLLYRVAARFQDRQAQAVAARLAGFGHTNQEEWWTLLWRDPSLATAPMSEVPLSRHFEDSGVFFHRTSWNADATAFALKAGPPEGHRTTTLLGRVPEWGLSSGHAHPDAGSFIIWACGRYLTGDTGYAGQPQARHHNTITVGGAGQGDEGEHDVWRGMSQAALDTIRITRAEAGASGVRVDVDAAGAYPASAGLTRFHRTFTFDGTAGFTVEDAIQISTPKSVEWFLHADAPFAAAGDDFVLDAGPARLRVRVEAPAGSKTSTGMTNLMAPGKPGSITDGKQEQRGYEIRTDVPASSAVAIKAVLAVEKK
jgi:hypothetical protein